MIKTLSDLDDHTEASIISLKCGIRCKKRMEDLGFVPGTKIKKLSSLYRGPVVVEIKDSIIAIGRGEALKILVDINGSSSA